MGNLMKRMLSVILIGLGLEAVAWNSTADFECASTNALENTDILVSDTFGTELTNFVATVTNCETEIEAKLVLCERLLACYTETLNVSDMHNALYAASNLCNTTYQATNMWYCWQSQILLFKCLAQNNNVEQAYNVASNAIVRLGSRNITSDNLISLALLSRNKAKDLTISQSVVLAGAMSAAMLKRNEDAGRLSLGLPQKYREIVLRLLSSDDWL